VRGPAFQSAHPRIIDFAAAHKARNTTQQLQAEGIAAGPGCGGTP